MKAATGQPQGQSTAALVVLLGSLVAMTLSVTMELSITEAAVGAVLLGLFISMHRAFLQWPTLVTLLVLVILFIPIRRYTLPFGGPIQLEPYRVVVTVLLVLWMFALLVDPRVRLHRSGFEAPFAVIVAAAIGSVIFSFDRIAELKVEAEVTKAVTFLVSFIMVFFFVTSVVRTIDEIRRLTKVLVFGGAVIGVLAAVESRTGYNPFNHLTTVIPLLEENHFVDLPERGARLRAIGPAEHAIGLGAALALLLPLAIYLVKVTAQARWMVATSAITIGVLSTVSRTGVLMLAVIALVYLWLRPRETKRLWPLVIPLIVVVHFALPGTLGTLKYSFSPPGGLIAEQRGYNDTGRVGDLGPTFAEVSETPFFGQGLGSRIVADDPNTGKKANARILDDQWLATLLETGLVGFVGWLWFFLRFMRRVGHDAKHDLSERGWLLVALVASAVAYAISMVTYDAFSFIQVTFLLYILAALAVVAVGLKERSDLALTIVAPAPSLARS